ncbi:NSS family neurotransmitter:Na+ symporter [Desulfitispora alkaliphila]|uniref:sodium-dependent transporter n=1 Tax=Desulfitispora alkaliphila TaxID=622674 RepID=UPI003D1FBBAE
MSKGTGRETWTSNYGFVLACIGAAMGLGSIWMFPWRLGAYGGAAFLLPYLVFMFALGITGLMGEFAFGRSQKRGAIGAFENVLKEKGSSIGPALGALPVLGVTGVFVFYLIVVGWIFKYFALSLTGAFNTIDIPAYFGGFAGSTEAVIWHAIALVATLIIVKLGVSKGIEAANKYMMPALFVILLLVAIRAVTLPGAMEGVRFILFPDWSYLAQPITYVMALGQAFFSVALGGAGMLVYGSYLRDDQDIPSSAFNTAFFTTIAGLLAAFAIIPAAFAFNLPAEAGPPLLFITLPNVFAEMPGGYIFGVLFFLSVLFAAVSSAINLMEVPVEAVMDRFNWGRDFSVLAVAVFGFVVGLPLTLNMNYFGMFADFVTIYLVPLGAVLAAIVFFWVFGISNAREEINKGAKTPIGAWWEPIGKYVFVGVSVAVLVLGVIYGGF